MAASSAPPGSLLPLLLLALLVAAADATVPGSFNAETVCLKTTDVKSCKFMMETKPPNIMARPDARSVAEACITTASWWTQQYMADAVNALQECKEPDKCLDNCVKTIAAMNEALQAPAGAGEAERLPAIHRHLTALIRGGPNEPRPSPPLCKTCCEVETCPPMKLTVVTQFRRMWTLLDFLDVVLEELYPRKVTATVAVSKTFPTTVTETPKMTISPATGSTADNTYGDDAKSNMPSSTQKTSSKETSEVTSSPQETFPKETPGTISSPKKTYSKGTSEMTSSPQETSKETSETTSSLKKTYPKETSPKETSNPTSSPKETSPKETSETTSSPIKTYPKETSETTSSPKDTYPKETSPKETSPEETPKTISSLKETSPKKTSKTPSYPKETSPEETSETTSSPKETSTKETFETTSSPKETSEATSSPKKTSKTPSSVKDTYAPAPPVTTYD